MKAIVFSVGIAVLLGLMLFPIRMAIIMRPLHFLGFMIIVLVGMYVGLKIHGHNKDKPDK